jgi:hypothetical protein
MVQFLPIHNWFTTASKSTCPLIARLRRVRLPVPVSVTIGIIKSAGVKPLLWEVDMTVKQPNYIFSAWLDYEEWSSQCSKCGWEGFLRESNLDWETDMVSSLRCPKCTGKLALLNNQASLEEIIEFAQEGSKKAARHLKKQ